MIPKYIEEKAEEILRVTGQKSAPIDILKCAKYLGVEVEEAELEEDIFGLLVIKNKLPLIIVNSKGHNDNRQRFTIAHELGHFLLHSRDTSFFIDKGEILTCRRTSDNNFEEAKEKEANDFAVSILLPDRLIEREALSAPQESRFNILPYLSNKFQVDESPLGIKLSHLGLLEYGFSSHL